MIGGAIGGLVGSGIAGDLLGIGDSETTRQSETQSRTPGYTHGNVESLWEQWWDSFTGVQSPASTARAREEYTESFRPEAEAAFYKWMAEDPRRSEKKHKNKFVRQWMKQAELDSPYVLPYSEDSPKSYEDLFKEDVEHVAGIDETYTETMQDLLDTSSTDTTANTGTYQTLLDDLSGQTRTAQDDYTSTLDTMSDRTDVADDSYLDRITATLADADAGTGLYKPINLSFGGQDAMSFVPKTNRNLATELLGINKEGMTTEQDTIGKLLGIGKEKFDTANTSIANLEGLGQKGYDAQNDAIARLFAMGSQGAGLDRDYGTEHTPNEVQRKWTDVLQQLAFYTNIQNPPTTTTTGEARIPGDSWIDVIGALAPAAGAL